MEVDTACVSEAGAAMSWHRKVPRVALRVPQGPEANQPDIEPGRFRAWKRPSRLEEC